MLWIILAVAAIILWALFRSPQRARPVDLSILPERFIIFDLETTGLNPDRNKIIEIGAIRVHRDSNRHDTFQALIKIKGSVPAKITDITGITTEMLMADGDPIEQSLNDFLEFIGDLRLVSFNAPFDVGFMNAALVSCGKPRLKNPVSCALDMSRRAWPGRRSYKLKDLAKDAKLGTQNHRALGDCQLAMLVYAGAVNELRRIE